MSSTKRHESLIPLSREHHYSLVVCLHIHQGLGKEPVDPLWVQARAEAVRHFFAGDLKMHFETEEQVLFPAMLNLPGAAHLIHELIEEHRKIENLTVELQHTEEARLATPLAHFADLVEAHIRKEERSLFPIFEQHVTPMMAEEIGWEIEERIGLALQPRHPELLR